MHTVNSLPAVIDVDSNVLILGTMPGDISLKQKEYYADPDNQFWYILSKIYNEAIGSSYSDKLRFLSTSRLALWDVLQSCEREGSSDKTIRNPIPNDFASLFKTYSSVKCVVFNGSKAEKLFNQLVAKKQQIENLTLLQLIRLSSTSPTPGKYAKPLAQKIIEWRKIIHCK